MKNIECEIRSFLTREQYEYLVEKFKKEAEFLGEDEQITYYFDTKEDLRIQKNSNFSKIWLKKGKIHDESREEFEIKVGRDDFEKLEHFFAALGYGIKIKWFRHRNIFKWGDIDVMLDYTRGYGYIIEFEKMADESDKERVISHLKEKFQELNIPLTPKEEFDRKFRHYEDNWQKLI